MKKVQLKLIVFILTSGFGFVNAQEKCGTQEILDSMLLKDPSLRHRMDSMERVIQETILNSYSDSNNYLIESIIQNPDPAANSRDTTYYITNFVNTQPAPKPKLPVYPAVNIPVVFHVFCDRRDSIGGKREYVSDERIKNQIKVLNRDFAKSPDNIKRTIEAFKNSIGQNSKIEFCLAQQDPKGNPTGGINRINYANGPKVDDPPKFTYSDFNNGLISKYQWDQGSYLNIFVCNLYNEGFKTFASGYAYIPGVARADRDGIVINYRCISTTSLTDSMSYLTHEAGHYFNLLHTWGSNRNSDNNCDDDDKVSDTPLQEGPTDPESNPMFPLFDKCTKEKPGIMFCNYMDYGPEKVKSMFTQGQVERMRAVVDKKTGARRSLLVSKGCQKPTANMRLAFNASIEDVGLKTASVLLYPNPSAGRFVISSDEMVSTEINFRICNLLGEEVLNGITVSTPYDIDLSSQPNGIYFLNITAGGKIVNEKIIITR